MVEPRILLNISKRVENRTIHCIEVADRPLPDSKFFDRDIGDRER
jgi:hypothetical protein